MKGENSSRQKHKTIKGICVQKCPAIYLEELSSIVDTLNKIGLGLPDNDQSELYNLTSAMAMRTAEKSPGLTIIGQPMHWHWKRRSYCIASSCGGLLEKNHFS